MKDVLQAKKWPEDLAGCGWYETLPQVQPGPVLDGEDECEWLVIGAGFAGLSAARRILQSDPSADICILEAQSLAWGACGRNSGFMIDLPHELQSEDYAAGREKSRREIAQNRRAIEFASETAEQFDLQAFFDRCGKYHGAADTGGVRSLESFASDLEGIGEDFTRLDAAGMQAVTGTEFFVGGIHTPGCAVLQPAGYIQGLGLGLRDRYKKCRLYENSPAIRIEPGAPHRVHTPSGVIKARNIILTINGHLASFGLYPRRLLQIFTFASMTRALTEEEQQRLGGLANWALIPAHTMGSTIRRTADNRIMVRNTFTYNPDMETSKAQVERLGRRHDRSFLKRFPMLENVDMEYRWGGHLCLSRNSTPVFGELEPRLYAACCHNGLGTCKGTLTGMLIADLAMGNRHSMVEELLDEEEPSRLPPEPFTTLGARAYLEWIHWRAGNDL